MDSNGQLFDPELSNEGILRVENKSTTSKARASVPDSLMIKKVNERFGVFSRCSFSHVTQFGPLEAPFVTKNEVDMTKYFLKLDMAKCRLENMDASDIYLDTTDENICNWMIFVEPATSYAEQNLCAHQEADFIYYTTCRDIALDEELRVWYSPSYAKFLSASVLTPSSGFVDCPKPKIKRTSGRKPKTSIRMQVFLDSSVPERDVRSVPPKKRGWRRSAKDKRPYGSSETSLYLSFSDPKRLQRKSFLRITKSFECVDCSKTFKNKDKLRIHSVVHSDVRNFLCHLCGAMFKRKDKLHDHVINVHNNDKVEKDKKVMKIQKLEQYQFKCSHCEIGFRRRGMFVNHLIKRHPGVPTSTITELNNPILKPVRDYHCPYCDKVYKSSTKRKLHIQNKHPGFIHPPSLRGLNKNSTDSAAVNVSIVSKTCIALTPVCCPYCNRQYSTKHKMNKHVRDKHPDVLQPEKTKTISTNQSSSNFTSNSTMPTFVASSTIPYKKGYHQQDCSAQLFEDNLDDMNSNENDLLTQAMSALQPSTQEPTSFATDLHDPTTKEDLYSRYAGSRKYMVLKLYDSDQNSAQVSEKIATYSSGKQLPYKNRLLANEQSWKDASVNLSNQLQCDPNTLDDIAVQGHISTVPQCYDLMQNVPATLNTILEPAVNSDMTLLSSTDSNTRTQIMSDQSKSHHMLQPVFSMDGGNLDANERLHMNAYQNNASTWIYQ